jgi:glycosyltransferase involved in cell wall biosynthesis
MAMPMSQLAESGNIRISVVIPAYNEAENLPHILPLIPDWVYEVILVNDQSTDNTAEVARSLLPLIRILHTQEGRGKGAALQRGFAEATGDIIVMMDADGSSDPDEIPRFVEALLAGAFFARGSRFLNNGGGSDDITHLRSFGSRLLIAIANQLFRMHCTDMFCGLNAFWKNCFDYFEIDCDGFEVEMLLHLRARKANLEIVEVPSYERARIEGSSKFRTFRDGWRVLQTILKEWVNGRSVVGTVRMHRHYLKKREPWESSSVTGQIGITQ